jgi:hypothetical protein
MKWYSVLLLDDFINELILFVASVALLFSNNPVSGIIFYCGSCFVFNVAIPFYSKMAEGKTQNRYKELIKTLKK